MSQVSEIQALQELDDEGARLRSRLADVERLLAGDEELDAARAALASAETAVAPVRKDEVKLDGQVKVISAKIEQEEKKLYSGTVTNAKELQNIQHEVDSLKEQRARLSDQLIELELKLEDLNSRFDEAKRRVDELESKRAASVDGWSSEAKTLNAGITRIEAKRRAQREKVPPRALAIYERVKARRGGSAVARIQGNNCGSCRIQMPDSVRKQVFAPDALVQCPNCERILTVG